MERRTGGDVRGEGAHRAARKPAWCMPPPITLGGGRREWRGVQGGGVREIKGEGGPQGGQKAGLAHAAAAHHLRIRGLGGDLHEGGGVRVG